MLPPDWNATVQTIFADKQLAATSGVPVYCDVVLAGLFNTVEHFFRQWMARVLRHAVFLQGANMAMRRSAWQAVRSHLCSADRTVHEDFDLAIHLQELGHRVSYDPRLQANISARCLDVTFSFFVGYTLMNPRSYAAHHVPHYRRMYPVVWLTLLGFFPARALFRGRDPATGAFSLAYLLTPKPVNTRVKSAVEGFYLS